VIFHANFVILVPVFTAALTNATEMALMFLVGVVLAVVEVKAVNSFPIFHLAVSFGSSRFCNHCSCLAEV
jgi:hypothetical protein